MAALTWFIFGESGKAHRLPPWLASPLALINASNLVGSIQLI
jgi:hypothetical protein